MAPAVSEVRRAYGTDSGFVHSIYFAGVKGCGVDERDGCVVEG